MIYISKQEIEKLDGVTCSENEFNIQAEVVVEDNIRGLVIFIVQD